MNKRNIYLFLLSFFCFAPIFNTSCTQEKSIFDEKILKVPESVVFVETGKSTSVDVEGNGGYSIKVDKPELLNAKISGGKLHINGLKEGSTNLHITDKDGLYISLEVVVANIGSHETDSLALIDLFKNTNPAGWVERWQINFPVKYWQGVKLNDQGRVVELNLKANGLVGKLPASISKLFFLKKLDLSFNKFTNELPDISNLINLTKLKLNFMKGLAINPETIVKLTRLTKIEYLGLIDVKLTGPLPPVFDKFKHLRVLELSFINQTNFPLEVTNIKTLEVLEMYDANIGVLPREISKLTNLKSLVLANCNITGEIPIELSRLINLQALDLSDNKLVGGVPPEFNNLKKLGSILLFNNGLTSLPEDMRGMSNLRYIAVRNNNLQCNLPLFPDGMITIKLQNNKITGPLPADWSKLKFLKDIELGYNKISGTLPPSYGHMKSLEILSLQNNDITGTVPVSFADFKPKFEGDYFNIDLRSNRMSGVLDKKVRSNPMYLDGRWVFSPQQTGYGFEDTRKVVDGIEVDSRNSENK